LTRKPPTEDEPEATTDPAAEPDSAEGPASPDQASPPFRPGATLQGLPWEGKGPARLADDTLRGSREDLITPPMELGKAYLIVIRGRSVGCMLELGNEEVTLGRSPEVSLPVNDDGASRTHAKVVRQDDEYVLSDLQSTNGLFVNGTPVEHHVLRHGDRIQVGHTSVVKFCFQDEVEESFQKTLYEAATRDPLLGCYNRRYFGETLAAEFAASLRAGMPLSLMMLDLDHFTQVNDTYGHPAGDHALQEVVRLVLANLRQGDTLARYGGEEFAVVLRQCSAGGAVRLAERMRAAIQDHTFEYSGHQFRITTSVGIATFVGSNCAEPSELIQAADASLYEAKSRGRNRVVSANLDEESEAAVLTPRQG
jgi:diguanylate cyclase (GGDEF)-like protein